MDRSLARQHHTGHRASIAAALATAMCVAAGAFAAPQATASVGAVSGVVFTGSGGYSQGLQGYSLYLYNGGRVISNGVSGTGGRYTFYNITFQGPSTTFRVKAVGPSSPGGYCLGAFSGYIVVQNGQNNTNGNIGPNYGWGSCQP